MPTIDPGFKVRLPDRLEAFFDYCGGMGILAAEAMRQMFRRPFEWRALMKEADHLGVESLSIVVVTSVFIGMVLALQTAYALAAFGAKLFVGDVVSVSMVRELGPVLISLMVGGRVGAGITAEIGTMAVTEQVDAIRALAANPVKKIVAPKILAVTIMLPLLVAIADLLGILGGLLISTLSLNIPGRFYLNRAQDILKLGDLFSGLGKTAVFGFLIALIACHHGMETRGGADGVGKSTTFTVVVASITVLISDFFLTKLFLALPG